MDVDPTSSTKQLEKHYAELAEKTSAAIASEPTPSAGTASEPTPSAGTASEPTPSTANNGPTIQQTLPTLPRYQPPRPLRPSYNDTICRMFFPTSGHLGFDTVKTSDEYPPIEIVREMILYETRLRLSDSIQDIMDQYHTDEASVT